MLIVETAYSLVKKTGRKEIINLFPESIAAVSHMGLFKEKIQELSELKDFQLVKLAQMSYFADQ